MTQQPPSIPVPSEQTLVVLGLHGLPERIGGGFETDVFRTRDQRLALKLKHTTGSTAAMLTRAQRLERVADLFCTYLGPEHSLPSDYLIVASETGQAQILAVQPFLAGARPLDALDLTNLDPAARTSLLLQLDDIVARALACHRSTGYLPDLYGLGPDAGTLLRQWHPGQLLAEGWKITLGQPLLAAHNLMLTVDGRVVLVDYDPICHATLSCYLIYGLRAMLLRRDQWRLGTMLDTRK